MVYLSHFFFCLTKRFFVPHFLNQALFEWLACLISDFFFFEIFHFLKYFNLLVFFLYFGNFNSLNLIFCNFRTPLPPSSPESTSCARNGFAEKQSPANFRKSGARYRIRFGFGFSRKPPKTRSLTLSSLLCSVDCSHSGVAHWVSR